MSKVLGDVMYPNGKYMKDDEEKTRWLKCGVLLEVERDGRTSMRLKMDAMPVGAVAVEITVQAANNVVGKLISFRKNGNTNTRVTLSQKTQVATKQIYISGKVACDGDRIIEYFGTANDGDWTAAQITICGWYM